METKNGNTEPAKQLEQEVLNAMHQEVLNSSEGEKDKKTNRPNINYNNNPVRVSDALGVIFLGILSALLLWALLQAHKREREWLGKQ